MVLLHQTPQSSITMAPLMRLLEADHTCIAIDTPGFGLSDPLPGDAWSIADLAQSLADTLDVLGVTRAALCGQHTGATIGAEFALRWPQRVSCLALDGYTVFNALERESILPHQLYRFQPKWDGTHLLWAWARFRDGWMFFPWSVPSLATRRDLDMPSPQTIHDYQIMELLRSRESHRAVYPAVFAWDGLSVAQALAVPTLIGATAEDQLYTHLDRLHALPAQVRLLRCANGARAVLLQALAAHVRSFPAAMPNPPGAARDADKTPDGRWRGYAAGLAVRSVGSPDASAPLVVLHGAGAASETELQCLQGAQAGTRLAMDLPGHGDSGGPVLAPADAARQVRAALRALRVHDFHVSGRGLGAAVAVELAIDCQNDGDAVARSLTLEELRCWQPQEQASWCARYAPPIAAQWDGGHLLRLWNELRDRQLFLPWFERTRATARRIEPMVDAERLTAQVFAALRCSDWPAAHDAWLRWPVQRLALTPCPVRVQAVPGDGWARDIEALRQLAPRPA